MIDVFFYVSMSVCVIVLIFMLILFGVAFVVAVVSWRDTDKGYKHYKKTRGLR